jgi:hypothetical protein
MTAKYLSVPQAAAALGVTTETIRDWCQKYGFGIRLTPYSHWRIPASKLEPPVSAAASSDEATAS